VGDPAAAPKRMVTNNRPPNPLIVTWRHIDSRGVDQLLSLLLGIEVADNIKPSKGHTMCDSEHPESNLRLRPSRRNTSSSSSSSGARSQNTKVQYTSRVSSRCAGHPIVKRLFHGLSTPIISSALARSPTSSNHSHDKTVFALTFFRLRVMNRCCAILPASN
jgi:hypothetical protein